MNHEGHEDRENEETPSAPPCPSRFSLQPKSRTIRAPLKPVPPWTIPRASASKPSSNRSAIRAFTRPSASSRRRSRPRSGPTDGREVLNFCANNYLGLADHPDIIAAAKDALDTHGFGLASVRFICGTQDLHKQLEATIAKFFGTDDTILYTSCFDANGGLFETLLSEEDAIISDALNHASIIDGIRLCKAERRRYANGDMAELEKHLAEDARQAHAPDRDRRRVLDGRLHRQARRDRRAEEEIQRAADGRRFARDRLRRPDRPRLGRTARRHARGRRVHLDARQGARRRLRRLHDRQPGDHRPAAPAFAAVPVLEHAAAAAGRRVDQGVRDAVVERRRCATRSTTTRCISASA